MDYALGEGETGPEEEGVEEEELEEDEFQAAVEDGKACGACGGEFLQDQAEPSLCPTCWDESTEAERSGFVKATSDAQ